MSLVDLKGKRGLVVGIANEHSVAYGCARMFRACGADLALTFLNDKAEKYVHPLAQELEAQIFMECDVQNTEHLDNLFDAIKEKWGKLDFMLHSIAFAPKDDLHGRVVDSSLEGFLGAMDVSCHSFLRMSKRAAPLMDKGGSLLTVSYYGSDKAIKNYGIMGPVKAALESAVRYTAMELGPMDIRVNALSPGVIKTRAASGLPSFTQLLSKAANRHLVGKELTVEDVGNLAAFLVGDCSCNITGGVHYVDGGYNITD